MHAPIAIASTGAQVPPRPNAVLGVASGIRASSLEFARLQSLVREHDFTYYPSDRTAADFLNAIKRYRKRIAREVAWWPVGSLDFTTERRAADSNQSRREAREFYRAKLAEYEALNALAPAAFDTEIWAAWHEVAIARKIDESYTAQARQWVEKQARLRDERRRRTIARNNVARAILRYM